MHPRLFHVLFLSCRRATYLMEKQRSGSLTRVEQWRLERHMRRCLNCQHYHRQLAMIELGLDRLNERSCLAESYGSELEAMKLKIKKSIQDISVE